MTIHIESLSRPEHDDREEVGARDEGDDECESKNPGCLLQAGREHRILCTINLPEAEPDE